MAKNQSPSDGTREKIVDLALKKMLEILEGQGEISVKELCDIFDRVSGKEVPEANEAGDITKQAKEYRGLLDEELDRLEAKGEIKRVKKGKEVKHE